MTQRLTVGEGAARTGMLAPSPPDRGRPLDGRDAALGADAGGGLRQRGGPLPRPRRAPRRPRDAHLRRARRRTNALARGLRGPASREGDASRSSAATTAASSRRRVACSKLGASALLLNTSFAGPQIAEVLAREDPVALIYDEEFTEPRRRRRARAHTRASPGATRTATAATAARAIRRSSSLIASGDEAPLAAAARARPRRDPDLGHDRHARRAPRATSPTRSSPAAALFSRIPLRARETTLIAAPLFHSWGYAHFTLGAGAVLDARAAAALRPRGDAARDRPPPPERAGRRAGDAAADPRARAARRSPATTPARCG